MDIGQFPLKQRKGLVKSIHAQISWPSFPKTSGSEALLASWVLHLTSLQCKPNVLMCRKLQIYAVWTSRFLFSPLSFSLVYDLWLHEFQSLFLFLPFSFFHFYACWSWCMWRFHTIFSLFTKTPSCTVTLLYFFLEESLHSCSKTPLFALNSGGQPVSCSIMVLSFDHLLQPHPGSSGWGPDEVGLPCPTLVTYSCVQTHVAIMCSWEYSCFLFMLRLFV